MKPTRVHLVRHDGEKVPFLIYSDGTVYEERESGNRRVKQPSVLAMVRRELAVMSGLKSG